MLRIDSSSSFYFFSIVFNYIYWGYWVDYVGSCNVLLFGIYLSLVLWISLDIKEWSFLVWGTSVFDFLTFYGDWFYWIFWELTSGSVSHSSISLTGTKDDPTEFKDAPLLLSALLTVKAVGLSSSSCYLIIKIINNYIKIYRHKYNIKIIN